MCLLCRAGFDPTEGYIVHKDRRFKDKDKLDKSPDHDKTGNKASTHECLPSVDDVKMQQITAYDVCPPPMENKLIKRLVDYLLTFGPAWAGWSTHAGV